MCLRAGGDTAGRRCFFSAYYHVTKTIEAIRGNLFDVITQYRAVFSDDDSVLTSSLDVDAPCDSLLFHNWLVQKVKKKSQNYRYNKNVEVRTART